jgi:hypothetical protein
MWEWMYRSTFHRPRHYLDLSGQLYAMVALSPEKKKRYPLDRRLGGPQSRPGRYEEVKVLDPTGTRTPTLDVQPVASRYTDCATATHADRHCLHNIPSPESNFNN